MVAPRKLLMLREQVSEVAAPAGGIVSGSQPTGRRSVKHALDPTPHSRGRLRLRLPDRLETREHVVSLDIGEALVPDRSGVGRERRAPLRPVLLVTEARLDRVD